MAKIIRSFDINTSIIPSTGATIPFVIKGDVGAKFRLQVLTSSVTNIEYYYNFKSKKVQLEPT